MVKEVKHILFVFKFTATVNQSTISPPQFLPIPLSKTPCKAFILNPGGGEPFLRSLMPFSALHS